MSGYVTHQGLVRLFKIITKDTPLLNEKRNNNLLMTTGFRT